MTIATDALVRLSDVTKSYGTAERRQQVLDGVSAQIGRGEMVAVTGPSGCGKTTLLNLIGSLDRPDSGTIRSCGVDLARARGPELTAYRARSIGFVFQFYNLLPTLTAAENVQAGLTVAGFDHASSQQRALRMLDRVGLADSAEKFPSQLSGGEQQRVALARALAKDPALILADEPTGNLDEDSGAQVMALIRELNTEVGVAVVLVTHNPAVSALADRTIHLAHGRLDAGGHDSGR